MKKVFVTAFSLCLFLMSCGEDNDDVAPVVITTSSVNFKLTNTFNDTTVNETNFTSLQLTNANGEVISIERIRYLISNLVLVNDVGVSYKMKDYNLLDLSGVDTYTFNSDVQIPAGNYKLSLVWGFNEADNIDGVYPDLNSVSWNWPTMLGGGYHFLQFDGKYNVDTTTPSPFNFHNGTAKDSSGNFEQNFVIISLPETIIIGNNTTIELKMDIAELFKNPNTWDLNVLDTPLMPNYSAQKMMQANVASVFSLGEIIQ